MCFGNEPSWGLSLERPGEARLDRPDAAPVQLRGASTEVPFAAERIWRGRSEAGAGELVAFLRETPCSDGMSDRAYALAVTVIMDGQDSPSQMLTGCCSIAP